MSLTDRDLSERDFNSQPFLRTFISLEYDHIQIKMGRMIMDAD